MKNNPTILEICLALGVVTVCAAFGVAVWRGTTVMEVSAFVGIIGPIIGFFTGQKVAERQAEIVAAARRGEDIPQG